MNRFQLPDVDNGHMPRLTRHKRYCGSDGEFAECGVAPSGSHTWSVADKNGVVQCLWCHKVKKVDKDKRV